MVEFDNFLECCGQLLVESAVSHLLYSLTLLEQLVGIVLDILVRNIVHAILGELHACHLNGSILNVLVVNLDTLSLSELVLSEVPCQSLETLLIVLVDELLLVLVGLKVLRVVGNEDALEQLVRVLQLADLLENMSTDILQELEVGVTLQLVSGSDSLSYTAGYVLADIVRDRFLAGLGKEVNDSEDSLQLSLAYQGLFDALRGDTTLFKTPQAERFLNNRVSDIRKAKEEKLKKVGIDFLKENAQKEGVVTLPSGLQYKVLKQGNGAVAKANDKVKVKYEGRLIDGTVFDSTDKHGGDPVTFSPSQVIKGWTEALCLMPVGSKWQLYIPQELAYGPRGAGNDIPPYSTLIFDVEVIDIEVAQEAKATEEVKPAEEVKQEVKPAKATKKKNTKK